MCVIFPKLTSATLLHYVDFDTKRLWETLGTKLVIMESSRRGFCRCSPMATKVFGTSSTSLTRLGLQASSHDRDATYEMSERECHRYFVQGLPHHLRLSIFWFFEQNKYTNNELLEYKEALKARRSVLIDDTTHLLSRVREESASSMADDDHDNGDDKPKQDKAFRTTMELVGETKCIAGSTSSPTDILCMQACMRALSISNQLWPLPQHPQLSAVIPAQDTGLYRRLPLCQSRDNHLHERLSDIHGRPFSCSPTLHDRVIADDDRRAVGWCSTQSRFVFEVRRNRS
ncbi:hypothetical protein J3A83DRAFT_4228543 [Scleroderma citrinum]